MREQLVKVKDFAVPLEHRTVYVDVLCELSVSYNKDMIPEGDMKIVHALYSDSKQAVDLYIYDILERDRELYNRLVDEAIEESLLSMVDDNEYRKQ